MEGTKLNHSAHETNYKKKREESKGKTERDIEFYNKYGIWGNKRQLDEYFRWKKGNRAMYSELRVNKFGETTIPDDELSLEEEIKKEIEEIEKEELEFDDDA